MYKRYVPGASGWPDDPALGPFVRRLGQEFRQIADGTLGPWAASYVRVASAAGPTLTLANAIPAGSALLGVACLVQVTFGNSSGLTSFNIGDGTTANLFGNHIARTAGTTTGFANHLSTFTPAKLYVAATNVVLTAVGGNFDTAGALAALVYYATLTAPLS